jgi:hypothetical protein
MGTGAHGHDVRGSALWGSGKRGSGSRGNALWGNGKRRTTLVAALTFAPGLDPGELEDTGLPALLAAALDP